MRVLAEPSGECEAVARGRRSDIMLCAAGSRIVIFWFHRVLCFS
jgi:hypothetical protein